MKKIIIIGGGISGLSSAWKLSEKRYKEDVINYKVIKVPNIYPIYRKDYETHLKKLKNTLLKLKTFFYWLTRTILLC